MIQANVGNFTINLAKIIEQAKENGAAIARKIALELETRVILKTPVDTGMLRNRWSVSLNSIDNAEYGADKTGQESISRALGELSSFKLGDTIWITNNLPYMQNIEFGLYGKGKSATSKTINGYSSQAPQGVIRITFKEVSSALEDIARKVVK